MATRAATGFKGNKAHLPTKPCQACGRPMSWRKAWAKNWEAVKFCSEACRRRGARSTDAGEAQP
jgi:hypothetical protein